MRNRISTNIHTRNKRSWWTRRCKSSQIYWPDKKAADGNTGSIKQPRWAIRVSRARPGSSSSLTRTNSWTPNQSNLSLIFLGILIQFITFQIEQEAGVKAKHPQPIRKHTGSRRYLHLPFWKPVPPSSCTGWQETISAYLPSI